MVGVRGSNVGCWLACVSSALLLLVLPAVVRGYESPAAEQVQWAAGGLEDDAQPPRPFDTLLYFPRQSADQRSKRPVRPAMGGGLGGGFGGLSMGGGGGGPSLSVVAPLDLLRQRVVLEMMRRKMRESEGQIQANREMLNSVGKRSVADLMDADNFRRIARDTSRKSTDAASTPPSQLSQVSSGGVL